MCVCESGRWPLHVILNFFEKFEFPPAGGLNSRESDLVCCCLGVVLFIVVIALKKKVSCCGRKGLSNIPVLRKYIYFMLLS